MKHTLLGFIAAFAFSSGSAWADDKKEEKKDEAAKIEGKWVATSYQRGAREVPKDMIKTELTITKGAYEFPTGINKISMKGPSPSTRPREPSTSRLPTAHQKARRFSASIKWTATS